MSRILVALLLVSNICRAENGIAALEQQILEARRDQCEIFVKYVHSELELITRPGGARSDARALCGSREASAREFRKFCDHPEVTFAALVMDGNAKEPSEKLNRACFAIEDSRREFCSEARHRMVCDCDSRDPVCSCLKNSADVDSLGKWDCGADQNWDVYFNVVYRGSMDVENALRKARSDLGAISTKVAAEEIVENSGVKDTGPGRLDGTGGVRAGTRSGRRTSN
ncbi:MAG: hypothetical protein HY074_17540 [Deltaproteobacteria bacterium]|nr:hypothetical protein [Deltaproteobacteria bacterium]